jgi:hypothetical protein
MSQTNVIVGITVAAVIAGLAYVLAWAAVSSAPTEPRAPAALVEFTAEGKLKQLPGDYRKWVFIGTPLTVNDGEGQFHSVYMDPESFAHYAKTGKFRDGTVVVKELIAVGSREAPSGKGFFMGEFTGLEVSIKDSKRFKDEPGNWAYFHFGEKYPLKAEASREAVASCNECHQTNARTDWVFSQYYPVLRVAAKRPQVTVRLELRPSGPASRGNPTCFGRCASSLRPGHPGWLAAQPSLSLVGPAIAPGPSRPAARQVS